MQRCLNDVFSYCYGVPQTEEKTETEYFIGLDGRASPRQFYSEHCINDHRTCSFKVTWAQEIERMAQLPGPLKDALAAAQSTSPNH